MSSDDTCNPWSRWNRRNLAEITAESWLAKLLLWLLALGLVAEHTVVLEATAFERWHWSYILSAMFVLCLFVCFFGKFSRRILSTCTFFSVALKWWTRCRFTIYLEWSLLGSQVITIELILSESCMATLPLYWLKKWVVIDLIWVSKLGQRGFNVEMSLLETLILVVNVHWWFDCGTLEAWLQSIDDLFSCQYYRTYTWLLLAELQRDLINSV